MVAFKQIIKVFWWIHGENCVVFENFPVYFWSPITEGRIFWGSFLRFSVVFGFKISPIAKIFARGAFDFLP